MSILDSARKAAKKEQEKKYGNEGNTIPSPATTKTPILDSARRTANENNSNNLRKLAEEQVKRREEQKTPSVSLSFNDETKNAFTNVSNRANSKTTFTSDLTEEERNNRINEIRSELISIGEQRSGLSRAAMYGDVSDMVERNNAREAELKEELKALERVGTFSASETKQWEIDEVEAKIAKLEAKLSSYGPRPSTAVAEEYRATATELSQAKKELDDLKREKALYDNVTKYSSDVNEETGSFWNDFGAQWSANYRSAELNRLADQAFAKYLDNPTDENKEIAYTYDALAKQYMTNNEKALDDEGQVLPWLTQSAAGYLPQFKDQIIPEAIGYGLGFLVGSQYGDAKVTPAITSGIASGLVNYPVMRGSVYRTLLAEGVDEETALAAANDEALLSSLIEGGETAASVLMMGGTKALGAIGNAAKSAVAKGSTNAATKLIANIATSASGKALTKAATEASNPLWKTGLKALGGILGNGVSEYGEEFIQQGISIANRERALNGNADKSLILDSGKVILDAVTGKNPEALAEMHESGKEGGKIGLMFGGTSTVVNSAISRYFNAKTIEQKNEIADAIIADEEALTVLIDEGKESGGVSAKLAKEVESAKEKGKVTRSQVKRLIESNEVYIKNEEQTEPDTLEKAAMDVVNGRNGTQTSEDKPHSTFEGVDEQTPTREETTPTTKNNAPLDDMAEAEARANKAAFDAGRENVPRESLTFETQAQEDAYNAGRVEHIKNMKSEENSRNNIENAPKQEYNVSEQAGTDESYPMREAARAVVADIERGLSADELLHRSFEAITARENILLRANGGRKLTEAELQEAKIEEGKYFYYKDAVKNPQEMLSKLKPFVESAPKQSETATETATIKSTPETELDNVIKLGTGFVDGKKRVVEFYSGNPSKAEAVEFLKKEYGIGGQTFYLTDGTRGYTSHDGKGIKIDDHKGDVLKFTWSEVDHHIRNLIDRGEYGEQVTSKLPANKTDERVEKAAKVIQERTGITKEEAVEKASAIWSNIDERNGRSDTKESANDVHERVLGRESDNDNEVRQSEPTQKAEEERNVGAEDRKLGEDVAGENGRDVQDSEGAETSERSDDSRSDDNGVRESDDSNGDSGVGAGRNDNVDEVKAKDYTITKAVAEELDTKAPSMDDNINAIKVLQELEASGKTPTKTQQSILAKFKGWGGLSSAFWRDRSRLKEIMTDEEISAAQSTVNDAYFTPTNIIDGVYKALAHLGFEGGNILEPSMGVGNFFGRMPKGIKDNSSLFGVEIDTISGRIAQFLYPSAKIEISPFQDVAYKDGAFDLIVGNVPFGEVKYKYKGNKYLIHDYFFIKAMDKLNDGGVMAFLTSRGTLDKIDSKTRAELARQGKLIAAYRLPSSVFSKSASANVVTDLIIIQKSADTNGERFTNLGNVKIAGEDISINEYFVNHPENIIGQLTKKWNYRSQRYELDVRETGNVAEQLAKAVKKLPKGLLSGTQTVGSVSVTENTAPMNTFAVKDGGTVEYIDAQTGEVKQLKGKSAETAKAYIKLNEAYQALIDSTLAEAGTEVVENHRKELNTLYDGFVKKYGTLEKNKKVLSADNDFVKLSGLEVYDTKTKSIIKSEMFTKDTLGKRKPKKADSALDALSISIGESGGVNISRIAELTSMSEAEVIKQLDDWIVFTPDGTYELNEVYLSGNVREKYEAVKGKKGFEKNERMLKDVIPEDIPAKNITPQFGSPWIAPNYVADFLSETLNLYSKPTVSYDPTTGTWVISGDTWGDSTLMSHKYGTKYIDALKLAEKALNMRKIVVKDSDGIVLVGETRAAQQKAEDIKAAFEEWCFKDAGRRQELVTTFNEKFNSHRNMDFSELAKYLTFDGLTETFKLRDYQKRAVARAIFNGNTLLAHGVGTGKTAEMIAIAMELKRMGIAKKNMMVVPNHKVADFRNDILKMYPSAKVIMLEKGANASQRQRFYAQVAANDFDIVVIPHSSFGMLDVSDDTKTAFVSNQLAELEEVMIQAQQDSGKKVDGRFIRQLENQKKRLEEKLKAITESAKDGGNSFEELGVDSLFVDEAHNFKNLPFYSKLSRVAGVSVNQSNNKTRASRAENMFMITDYLNRNNGRITFGTATPITNSMSEIYNMIRFLRPEILADSGIQSFDAWASMFGSIVNQAEVDPSGRKFRMKERFSKFKNVAQMVEQFRRMADILKTGDVIQELPVAERIDVINESNEYQEEFLDIVDAMIDEIRHSGQNAQHNMLEVTTAGQMAAVDLRFVESYFDGRYTRDELNLPNNRISRVAEKVLKEYNDSNDRKGTQFVFCDVGINDDPSKKYNLHVYGDLINRLVAGGIPREEIAVAQDFEDKAELSARVNTGEIRVLIGSTAVMGEGMNAQNKAVALHHMTVPYRPSDIEQREGRIIRYGNENKHIRIYRYIQEKSYDSYQWQMQERKAAFINQALSGGTIEELEEMSDFQLTAREAKAIASGNPLLIEKIEVEDKLNRLKSLRNKFNTDKLDMKDRLAILPSRISKIEKSISDTEADIKTITANETKDFEITFGKTKFTERAEAAKALEKAVSKAPRNGTRVLLGSYRGLDVYYCSSIGKGTQYILKGAKEYTIEGGESALGNITRIINAVEKIPSGLETAKATVKNYKSEIETLKKEVNAEFPQAKELDELQAKLNDIDTQLGINVAEVDMSEVVVGEEDDDTDAFIEGEEAEDDTKLAMWTTTRVGEKVKPKSISEIVATIEHDFGINITTGHIRGKGILGQYNVKNNGIRTKIANNLPVISHELGHYFERTFGIKEQLTEEMTTELTSQLNAVDTEKYSDEQLIREGVAEYIRRFLQNRETAAIDYPLFNEFFLKCFTAKDLAKFEQLADDINAYYSLDADTATSSIRLREEGGIDLRTPVEKLEDTASTIYQALIDSNHAIKRFDKATGSNAYMYATNAAYSDAIAGQIVTGDLTDKDGQYVSSGLKTVLHGIDLNNKEEYRLFGEYLVVKHGPERLKEGMRVFADDRKNSTTFMEHRQAELEAQYPQFEEVSERLYDFIKKFYKTWGVKTGLISDAMLESWGERWEFYVPFNRAVGKEQNRIGAKRGFANQNSTIKKAKGGGQDIYNPVDNLIDNIVKMVNAGVRNNVMLTIANNAEKLGADATFLEKVPMPLSVTKMDMTGVKDKLTNWLEESDLDDKSKDKAAGVVNNLDDILLQYGRGKAGGNVITVLKDGTPQAWKINDAQLLQSLTSLSPKTMDGVLDAIAVTSRFMTANITGNNIVWSIFSNLPRDFGTFFTYSKNKNVVKMAKGVGSAYLNKVKGDSADPLYKEFLAMGGGKTSAYTADRNLAKDMRKKLSDKKFKWDYVNPLNWISFSSDLIEAGPRFATYKMMREAGMTPQEAFYESMDITTNFRRNGRISKEINKVVPFFNASVQGLDKFRRWITAEELAGKSERKKAIRGRVISYVAVSAALAAIAYVLNNSDEEKEEEYEQLSTYIKNSYWVFPMGDGKYFAVPKPREIGVLSSFMECCMEYGIGENDHAFDEFYAYASENFLPAIANDIAQIGTKGVKETGMNVIGSLGLIGVFGYLGANRDFLGRPIVASGLQNLEPKDQYTDRTSKIAYWLGQAFNGSPEEIDYFMQQVLGGWWKGQKALFPVGEKNVDWSLGVGNTYIKDNQYSTDLTNWLYDRADTTARAKNSDPNNIDKAITAKWDSNMTDFYGTYYKKAKADSETTATRSTRQLVLDTIREYQKGIDEGYKTELQKAVEAVCKEKKSTVYLPSVMSGEIKDGNGKEHNLSDVQYVEYQTDYLRIYWETVEQSMTADMTTAEKARILTAAKTVAREQATERTLNRIGAPSSGFATKYSGVENKDITEFLAGVDLANDDKSVKKEEVVDIISGMNVDNDDAWTLYLSKYDSKSAVEAEKYGINAKLYMTAAVDMANITPDYDRNGKAVSGSRREKVQRYLNSVCSSYKEYLFLLATEFESVKKDPDYIAYFGK